MNVILTGILSHMVEQERQATAHRNDSQDYAFPRVATYHPPQNSLTFP